MAELADRIPGELILASYANDIRDRALMRYASAAARDLSVPLPNAGDLAYLSDVAFPTIYTGAAWDGFMLTDDSAQPINRNMILGPEFPSSPWKFESRRTVGGFQVGARWDVTSISAAAGDQGFSFAVDVDAAPVGVFQMLQNSVRSLVPFRSGDITATSSFTLTDEGADAFRRLTITRGGRVFRIDTDGPGFTTAKLNVESGMVLKLTVGDANHLQISQDFVRIQVNAWLDGYLVLNQSEGQTGTNFTLPLAATSGVRYAQLMTNQVVLFLDSVQDVAIGVPTTSGGLDVRYNNVGGLGSPAGAFSPNEFFPLRFATASSERFKKVYKTKLAATDPNHPRRLTEVESRTWRWKDGYLEEGDPRAGSKYLAPTAESMAEAMPFAVDFDEDGEPLNLNADVIRGALVWLAGDFEKRLTALERLTF